VVCIFECVCCSQFFFVALSALRLSRDIQEDHTCAAFAFAAAMTLRRCAPTTTSGCLCFVRALFVKTCKSSCVAATPLCHESLSLNAQGRGVEWSHRTSQGSCELFVSSSWRGAWGRGRGGERDERQCPHDVPCVEVVEHNRSRHDASQRRERLPPASLPPCFRTSVQQAGVKQADAQGLTGVQAKDSVLRRCVVACVCA